MGALEIDPFSLGYTAHPQPLFAALQRDGRLLQHEALGSWFAHGYDAVKAFCNHPQMGARMDLVPGFTEGREERMARWPITEASRIRAGTEDLSKHSRRRQLLAPDFKPTMIRAMSATVRDVVAKHCAPLQTETELDVVELVQEVPLTTISRILGIDEGGAHGDLFLRAAPDYFRGLNPLASDALRDQAEAAARSMYGVITELIEERRARPKDDLISQVAHVGDEMGGFSPDDIADALVVLVAAGTDTTRLASSLAIRSLLAHPERLEDLRADRSLLEDAILELLRFESPTKFLVRIASEDVAWKDQTIPKGSIVMLSTFAAGWDPQAFPEPQRLDFRRDQRGSLSFGYGARYCLGVHLAKVQIGAILDFFLDHVPPSAEIDAEGVAWDPANLFLREVTRLPMRTC
jgi:cytochrome P450